jgi:hypothetical protein
MHGLFAVCWLLAVWIGSVSFASPVQDNKEPSGLDTSVIELLEQPRGEAHFAKRQHDFGRVQRGQELSVRFTFENRGQGPLLIQGVHARCGCMTVEFPAHQTFLPGQQGVIQLKVNTIDFLGDFAKKVAVMTNESKQLVHVLKLKAHIDTEVHVDPPIVDFGGVAGETGAKRSIFVQGNGQPLQIRDILYNDDVLDVSYHQDGNDWWIHVYLQPGLAPSYLKESLHVINNSQHLSRLPIPIRADILSKIKHDPQYIEFGAVAREESVAKMIQLMSSEEFKVVSQRAEFHLNGQKVDDYERYLEFGEVRYIGDERRRVEVKLKNQALKPGSVHGRLIFDTSDPSQKQVVIDFYAFFQE